MALSMTETHDFTVGGSPTLRIRVAAGTVTLTRGEADRVSVRVTRRAQSGLGGATEADLAQVEVRVEQQDDTITIVAERHEHWSLFKNVNVDVEVSAPERVALDLTLHAGNATLRDLTGKLIAHLNAGNFEARNLTLAGHSRLTLNAGNGLLDAQLADSATFEGESNAGNLRLTLPAATNATLDAHANVGSVTVTGWPVAVARQVVRQEARGTLGDAGAPGQGALRLRVNAGSVTLALRA